MMPLGQLLDRAGLTDKARQWQQHSSLEIGGLSYDSRQVETGDLFIAVAGREADGHSHLKEAFGAGAVAAVVEHTVDVNLPQVVVPDTRQGMGMLASAFFGNPSDRLFMVGITGTNGKTTTAHLIRYLLKTRKMSTGLIGTIKYMVGEEVRDAPFTTPESLDIQYHLADMITAGESAAVMEVSSHALALGRIEGTAFDLVAFTNLGRDHLDFHESMDDYLAAKKTLFTHYRKKGAPAIMNVDDPAGARLAEEIEGPVVTVGISRNAEITATQIEVGARGLRFELGYGGERAQIESPLLGAFNIQNLLVAAAAGFIVDLPVSETAGALSEVGTIEGRMERLEGLEDVEVVLDYAHKPEALRVALQTCRDIAGGRVIVVFGCGGNRDRGKRPLMGRIAALGADMVIVTNDNPRMENPDRIIDEIVAGMPEEALYTIEPDRRVAISLALSEAASGDLVLIAGKGHEKYQIIGRDRLPFDEHEVIAEAIASLINGGPR